METYERDYKEKVSELIERVKTHHQDATTIISFIDYEIYKKARYHVSFENTLKVTFKDKNKEFLIFDIKGGGILILNYVKDVESILKVNYTTHVYNNTKLNYEILIEMVNKSVKSAFFHNNNKVYIDNVNLALKDSVLSFSDERELYFLEKAYEKKLSKNC